MIKISASFLLAKLHELRHGFECQEYLIAQMVPSTYHFIKRERYLILIYIFQTRWTVQLNPVCCFLFQNRPLRVVWLNNLGITQNACKKYGHELHSFTKFSHLISFKDRTIKIFKEPLTFFLMGFKKERHFNFSIILMVILNFAITIPQNPSHICVKCPSNPI